MIEEPIGAALAARLSPARLTPARAIAGVALIVLVVAGYEIIGMTLHIAALYMGFLFATYWGAARSLALAEWLPSVLGATFGILLAWLLHPLPLAFGFPGLAVVLVATLVPMYLLLRNQLAIVCNAGFLVFLTVATIPALTTQDDHLGMAAGMASGAIYAGALALALHRLAARRSGAAAPEPAGEAA